VNAHFFGESHFISQTGFTSHSVDALQFQEHCGSAHLLWQLWPHSVVHFAGAQTVWHLGQFPCSQCVLGQTTAHLGGSHLWWQVAGFIARQAVSHCGGAQVASQTSSHFDGGGAHDHQQWGWHGSSSFAETTTVPLAGGAMLLRHCPLTPNSSGTSGGAGSSCPSGQRPSSAPMDFRTGANIEEKGWRLFFRKDAPAGAGNTNSMVASPAKLGIGFLAIFILRRRRGRDDT
jgi:hypothetical protein